MDGTELLSGRYRLGPVLGRGGMGAVHQARDELLGRDVAVKLLDVDQAPDAAVQRFRREAQFLAGLAHPNVVTVFDFGTDDARAWLVMERLAGPTLQDLVDERGPLPIADVMRYGRECAAALAAAHAAGITHRDVKPANLMLAADGTCKLLDLGIARLDGAATTQPALTQAGTILGTVPYLAPEVITGATPQPPADMYALGGVLFALLTARPPFQGEDVMAAMAQHVHAPAPRPSVQRRDVPRPLDDLVVALLAKDPTQRPSATDVVTGLGALPDATFAPTVMLGGVAGATGETSAPRHRSHGAQFAVAAILALALLAVVLVVANSRSDSTGRRANSTATTPAARSTPHSGSRSITRSTTQARTRTPTPAPTTVSGSLAALQLAVADAQSSGGLSPSDAQDLLKRVSDIRAALAGPGPGPGDGRGKPGKPGKGPGKGKGHGRGKGDGGGEVGVGAPDITPMLDDFAHHLDDLRHKGAISGSDYSSITSALSTVRSLAAGGD